VNVFLLVDPSLPSCGWLLAGLHLLTHPLHHALHPNRWLPVVLIIFHLMRPFRVLGFDLGFRALLAASLHGFPSLHFRKNFKKVKKPILQQLPFPYMFPMIATVLPNALGSTVAIPSIILFIKRNLSPLAHLFFLSLSLCTSPLRLHLLVTGLIPRSPPPASLTLTPPASPPCHRSDPMISSTPIRPTARSPQPTTSS
jgi:hypothetical protein